MQTMVIVKNTPLYEEIPYQKTKEVFQLQGVSSAVPKQGRKCQENQKEHRKKVWQEECLEDKPQKTQGQKHGQ